MMHAELKWPFVGNVTYTLLNQLEDGNHHTEIITFNTIRNARVNSRWGKPKFIPHSALTRDPVKNTQYLKDDKLFFRVTVHGNGWPQALAGVLKLLGELAVNNASAVCLFFFCLFFLNPSDLKPHYPSHFNAKSDGCLFQKSEWVLVPGYLVCSQGFT